MHVQIRLANLSFLRMQDADSEGSDSEAEYISTTCLPHQPVPAGIAHSMPSGASRGPPPGFERPAPQVQLTPLSCFNSDKVFFPMSGSMQCIAHRMLTACVTFIPSGTGLKRILWCSRWRLRRRRTHQPARPASHRRRAPTPAGPSEQLAALPRASSVQHRRWDPRHCPAY